MAVTRLAGDLSKTFQGSGRLFFGLFLLFILLGSGLPQSIDETQMTRVAKGLASLHWHDLLPTKYAIGTSLFEVPFIWLGHVARRLTPGDGAQTMWVCLYLMPPMLGALSGVLTWALARALGQSPRHAALSVFCFAFASFAVVYQTRLFSEGAQTAALLTALVLVIQFQQSRSPRLLYGAGLALGCLFMLKPSTAAISGPLFALFLWRATRDAASPARFAMLARIAAAALPGIVVVLLHNRLRYGTIWQFGYSEERDLEYGFHGSLVMGLYGLTLSSGAGLILFMPVSVSGVTGLFRLRHCVPHAAILILGLPLVFVLFHARWWSWHGGWCWGPRFLVPVTPLLALGVGELAWEGWSRLRRFALWSLVGLSVLMQVPGLAVSSQDFAEQVMVSCRESFPSWHEKTATSGSGPVDDNLEIHFIPAFSPPLGHTWIALNRVFGDVGDAPWDGERLCEHLTPHHKPLEWWWASAGRARTGLAAGTVLGFAALLGALAGLMLAGWWKGMVATQGVERTVDLTSPTRATIEGV